MILRRWLYVLRHPRTWRRELRWARNDHHGHLHPDSGKHEHPD